MKNTMIGVLFSTVASTAIAEPIEITSVETFQPNHNAKGILLKELPETKPASTTIDCLTETINRHLNTPDEKLVGICYENDKPIQAIECEDGTCSTAEPNKYTPN